MVVVAEMGYWVLILKIAAPTGLSPPPTEHACKRCAQVEDFLQQMAELQEVVIKVCCQERQGERQVVPCVFCHELTARNFPSRPNGRQ